MQVRNANIPGSTATTPAFLGWRMVALGFIAFNLGIGLTFGTFGVLIKPVAAELQAARGPASFGIALILLLMGLAGPALGIALRRFSIRSIMRVGSLLMVLGFALASQATNFALFLVGYSLLGGIGCALLSVIPVSTLITNWFVARRGLAMGLISVPLLVAVMPPVAAWLVEHYDWRVALQVQAAMMLLMLPLLQLLIDRPEDVGQLPLGGQVQQQQSLATPVSAQSWSSTQLLGSGYFWGIITCVGLITCGGIVISSHLFAFVTDIGVDATRAALLMTIVGTSSMAGALLFGWVADRLGPRVTVGLIAVMQVVLWSIMLAVQQYNVIAVLLLGMGLGAGGVHPAFAAMLANTYGRDSFGVALGMATLFMLPFTFAAAPVAGWIFDISGSYNHAFMVQIGAFALGAVLLLGMYRRQPR